jgi:hypothetical protein
LYPSGQTDGKNKITFLIIVHSFILQSYKKVNIFDFLHTDHPNLKSLHLTFHPPSIPYSLPLSLPSVAVCMSHIVSGALCRCIRGLEGGVKSS